MRKDFFFENFKLKADTIFNIGELYKKLFKWFEVYGYSFWEREYKDIDEPGGKHVEIFWYAEKKIDEYVSYVIEINYLILGMSPIEIDQGGVKVKSHKSSTEFRISAYLLFDSDGKWSKTDFHKTIRNIYDKYVARERLDKLGEGLLSDTYDIIEEIKAFMNLHNF